MTRNNNTSKEICCLSLQWTLWDLNPESSAYEAASLTNWDKGPYAPYGN